MALARGRPKNRIEPLPPLKVPMTPVLQQYLEDIIDTELIGSTPPNVALALIREGIRRLIADGAIDRRKAKRRSGKTGPGTP